MSNDLLMADQLAQLEVKTGYPPLPPIPYVSIPEGTYIYRGGESVPDTQVKPAYYSSYDVAKLYTNGSNHIHKYMVNRDLRFVVPSLELFNYLKNIGKSKPILETKYSLLSSLYALLYGYKVMHINFVKNSAIYLKAHRLGELTFYANISNPGRITQKSVRNHLNVYINLFMSKNDPVDRIIPSRTSFRIFDINYAI